MAIHHFGEFTLDESSHQLTRGDGERVELSGRAFDLLVVLLRHRGEVVTRARLLDGVWQDSEVTDSALSQTLFLVRRALGPGGHQLIRTVSGRGYCIDLVPPSEKTAPDEEALPIFPPSAQEVPAVPPAIVPPTAITAAAASGTWRRRRFLWLGTGLSAVLVALAVWGFSAGSRPPPAPLTIMLEMAPDAPARDAWMLPALRGVMRTGLHGNLGVVVTEGDPDPEAADRASSAPNRSTLLNGQISVEAGSDPRRVSVRWTLVSADGRRERWVDFAPTDRLFDLASRAQRRLLGHDPSLALVGIGQMTGPVPEAALMLYARGIEEQARHHSADAAGHFEAALEGYPDLTIARLELAGALLDQGYRAAAVSHLRQVNRALAAKSDSNAVALRARSLYMARDFTAAAEAYEPLVAGYPEVLPWRLNAAEAHALAGNGKPALKLMASINPQGLSTRWAVEYHKIRAIALMALGDTVEATAAARAQLQEATLLREPELEAEAHLNLTNILYRSEDMAAATAAATRAVAAAERGKSSRAIFESRQFQIGLRMLNEQPVLQEELNLLLEAARSTGDIYREGAVQLTFANNRFRQLDLAGAIAHRQQALSLLERSGDRKGIDIALQSLFGLERLRGNRSEALAWLRRLEAGAGTSPLGRWPVEFERSRGAIWAGQPARALKELREARAEIGVTGPEMGLAALACQQAQAAVLAGQPEAAFAPLDACDAAIPRTAANAEPGVEQEIQRARSEIWRAIASVYVGRPGEAAGPLRTAEARVRALDGYRTMEILGELALGSALAADPGEAQATLVWIAVRPESRAAAFPQALVLQAQCILAKRQARTAATVCATAAAAADRIGQPVLRLKAPPQATAAAP